MDLLIKTAVVGIIGALIALVLKKNNPEMSLLIILAAGAVILIFAMDIISDIREVINMAASVSELSPAILNPVLKCVGIGIVTRLASDLCGDAGAGAIASAVELFGAASALYIALPLLKTLIQMIGELI